jgi:hypothetical protein
MSGVYVGYYTRLSTTFMPVSFIPDFEFFRVTAYFSTLSLAYYLMISTHLGLVSCHVTGITCNISTMSTY